MAQAELKARSTLDSKPFEAGMSRMGQKARSFVSGELKNIARGMAAAFTVNALINFGKSLGDTADRLNNLAVATGLTTDQLQAMEHSAKQAGIPFESVTGALMKLKDAQEEVAVSGNKALEESFARLGVKMQDILTLGLPAMMDKIAEGAARDATAVKDLNDIMGKTGSTTMKPFLAELQAGGGLSGMTKRAFDEGHIISAASLANIDALADKVDSVKNKAAVAAANVANLGGKSTEQAAREAEDKAANQAELESEGRLTAYKQRMASEEEKLKAKVEADGKKAEGKGPGAGMAGPAADQMQRIGAGLGTAPRLEGYMTRLEPKMDRMAKALAAIEELHRKVAENTANLTE